MRTVFVIIFSCIVLITAFTSRFMGALSYWWFTTFRPHEWVFDDISWMRLSLIATILFIIPCILQGKLPRFNNGLNRLIVFYVLLLLVAEIITRCTHVGIGEDRLYFFLVTVITVLFTTRVIEKPNQLVLFVLIIGLVTSFHAGKGGIDSLLSGNVKYGASGLGGFYTGSNAFAMASATMFFFALTSLMLIYDKNCQRTLLIFKNPILVKLLKLLLPIFVFGIVFNVVALFSRGSAIALAIGIVTWLFFNHYMSFKHLLLLTLFSLTVISFVDLPEGYSDRISSAFVGSEELDKSAASRPFFWGIAYEIAKDNVLGVGAACYNSFYNYYDTTDGYYGLYRTVHSSHFEVLAETGFLGILVWLYLFILGFKKCLRIRKIFLKERHKKSSSRLYFLTANMCLAILVTFFIGGSFYAMSYTPIIWLTFGIIVSLEHMTKRKLAYV
jgi:putative inorganic carbon (hco3(-)) transporter